MAEERWSRVQGEDDALDAFMAGISAEVTQDRAPPPRPEARLALDDDDAVADYMEVRRPAPSTVGMHYTEFDPHSASSIR